MSLIFTSHKGELIEVKDYRSVAITDSASIPLQPSPLTITALAMASTPHTSLPHSSLCQFPIATPLNSPPTYHKAAGRLREMSPKPIITVTDTEQLPASPNMAQGDDSPLIKPETMQIVRSVSRSRYRRSSGLSMFAASADTSEESENPVSWMVYNEYGELVTMEQMSNPVLAEGLTVVQALRLIYKTYHAEFKDKMREVLSPLLEGKAHTFPNDPDPNGMKSLNDKLSLWIFSPSPDHCQRQMLMDVTPEEEDRHAVPVYSGPPRVLDIGCADGRWCYRIKKEYPDWIVEGVDDINRWSNSWGGTPPRDFMEPILDSDENDYFCNVHSSQKHPEFTCRNINQLLSHDIPIPQNLYSLIRGRDVFDRVESYKSFLEDIRHLLQPSGVVEFVEVDPRPRCNYIGRRHSTSEHRSGAETDWTDIIADRFKDPYDAQLATHVPEWASRVEQRLQASLRPRDGVPAAKIKGWLQGAGFWDVKQIVIRLPIGGSTLSGQKLADLMMQELEIENSMPILAINLPEINLEHIKCGSFYLNLHIVTARKPKFPRPGDLLMDGTRQEMTHSKYEKMAERTNETKDGAFGGTEKGSGWKRYELDFQSSHMVASKVSPLPSLKGRPKHANS